VKRWTIWSVAILAVLAIASSTAGRTYALYYDAIEGHGTAIVLTNLESEETTARLSAYNSSGDEIATLAVSLAGFASEAVFLEEHLDAQSGRTWGLVRVETEGRIGLAAWIRDERGWLAIENVSTTLTVPSREEYSGYWLAANYANTPNRTTSLSLVNPLDEQVVGEIYLYDADGTRTSVQPFELSPRSSAYIPLGEKLEITEAMWGLADIHTDRPILLAAEYMDASGALIDVDVVSWFYLVES
jgi:hypothetical protein